MPSKLDLLVFGQRLRHSRRARSLTLDELGAKVNKPAPYLSTLENGRREPKLSLVQSLADALGVTTAELLDPTPPSRRARLEVAVERLQDEPLYKELRLPLLRPSVKVSDDVLDHVVTLFEALRQARGRPFGEDERLPVANAALRAEMRARDNYYAEIEEIATGLLDAVGYSGTGAVSERTLTDLAAKLGLSVSRVKDLPRSARSVTDLRNRRLFISQRNDLRTRDARTVVLQTLAHFALGHGDPADLTDYLRQRVETNYFAGAVLAPERAAVPLMIESRDEGDLAVEDLKELFYVSYEMAAHRFTNLATRHLDLPVHFLRSDPAGYISKAYENDGFPLPMDADGVIEGQQACRHWSARLAFGSEDSFDIHAQFTDTPAGKFWSATHVEADRTPNHAVTIGTRAEYARFFRDGDTDRRAKSGCPDPDCCRQPPAALANRWSGQVWANAHDSITVPPDGVIGPLAGVDLNDVYEFLDRHA